MSLLKPPKAETVKIVFHAPKALGVRLKSVEVAAKTANIPISLDDDLSAVLSKLLYAAEGQLGLIEIPSLEALLQRTQRRS